MLNIATTTIAMAISITGFHQPPEEINASEGSGINFCIWLYGLKCNIALKSNSTFMVGKKVNKKNIACTIATPSHIVIEY